MLGLIISLGISVLISARSHPPRFDGVEAGRPAHSGSPAARGLEERPQQKKSQTIEGNSFFIEEAYNQDPRFVHHTAGAFRYPKPEKDVFLSFGQEWPIGGRRHQLSYTIPYGLLNSGSVRGLGDIIVDYRYQLFDEDRWAAVSPRLSLILPTGSTAKGLGDGVLGIQVGLPASRRISERIVVHANLGWTFLPRARWSRGDGSSIQRNLSSYYFGGSFIFLASSKFNFMLEGLVDDQAEFNDAGAVLRRVEAFLSPGIRFAINIGRSQIVPGAAVPVTFSKPGIHLGMFLYLAFEHLY